MSDHRYIHFNISDETQNIIYKNTRKYIISEENWETFVRNSEQLINELNQELLKIENKSDLNLFINKLTESLTNICEQTFRRINYNKKFTKSNHWWSQELTQKRQEVNTSRRRYQRCQTQNRPQLAIEFQNKFKEYKQLMNKLKVKSWQMFVDNNTRENPWGVVYKISRQKLRTEKVSELKANDGSLITDAKEIALELLNSLFPTDSTLNDKEIHTQIRARAETEYTQQSDLLFSQTEVTSIIESQDKSKSPGLDGFTADIIKKFNSINQEFLTEVYNKCLKFGLFPDIWKIIVVKILKKPNKSDYTSPKAYRPISLLSVFAKVLEKLLINRISFYLKSNNLLNENQFGFMPQKSTIDAINRAVNFVKNTFETKGYALLIALDISGAFDNAFGL
jgi:hypothetical protein